MGKYRYTKNFSERFLVSTIGKEYIRKPAILKLIGNVKNKKILEIGCGNGYWLRLLAKKGVDCVGVDSSKNQIELAKEIEKESPSGITYHCMDGTNLEGIKSGYFDIVLIVNVLTEIKSRMKINKIIKEANRVLKNRGVLVIDSVHPFAPGSNFKNILPSKNYHYFNSGSNIRISAKQLDGKTLEFNDFHWTLQDLFDFITYNGFLVERVIEPKPSKKISEKYPQLKERGTKPLTIMIK